MSKHQIFRFKLSPEIVEMIHSFSKLHERADKKTYKEKWNEWLEINNELIDREKKRLFDLGFDKCVEDNKTSLHTIIHPTREYCIIKSSDYIIIFKKEN